MCNLCGARFGYLLPRAQCSCEKGAWSVGPVPLAWGVSNTSKMCMRFVILRFCMRSRFPYFRWDFKISYSFTVASRSMAFDCLQSVNIRAYNQTENLLPERYITSCFSTLIWTGCSHEINSHEINSCEINSHEINFSWDQFPYDQLL